MSEDLRAFYALERTMARRKTLRAAAWIAAWIVAGAAAYWICFRAF